MKRALIAVTVAGVVASIFTPAQAQTPWPAAAPQQWPWPQTAYAPGTTYQSQPYPSSALPPWDAYRQGLINRWELEQLQGPIPQALQGPSADGGNQGGGDKSD